MPVNHPLASSTVVSLEELHILLDEGVMHEPLMIFEQYNFEPDTQYRVYDPYAIMSMIEHGLGISILPKLLLHKCIEKHLSFYYPNHYFCILTLSLKGIGKFNVFAFILFSLYILFYNRHS
ncbi:LysR family transcriptional regulator substrate-binding protein [Peribacillus frigoritolerans]|uniref:LysR family transcriptional regulator substrate-binding protein n=1 Tax=Peribacillus frigoritolerans TaxID=450367 RepID=UPI00207A028E|nr:LysR family transcriptional regulator substrate-binding protein [Peribacillus frigoritolerans]